MNSICYKVFFVLISMGTISCQFFGSKPEGKVIAKVHDAYLYEKELSDFNIPLGLDEIDSVSLLTGHIDNWATKQLLLHKAKENMPKKKQREFESLVEAYKIDLFVSSYENIYVQKNLNTVITEKEINAYYKSNKQSFLLKEDLVKIKYIKLPFDYKDLTATRKSFIRYNDEDKEELDKIKLGFLMSYFNEENEWKVYDNLINELNPLQNILKSKVLGTKDYLQFKDAEGKYILKIDEVLKIGNPSPIEHVSETIKQIILNKRKLKLKQQLEKEITKDAIQTKDYTIFE